MYRLIPAGVAFAGMVLVTAFNAFIAWRQSAELLAVYAIVGAFSTPLLLSTGRDEEVFLFCYLLMMNAATMALLVCEAGIGCWCSRSWARWPSTGAGTGSSTRQRHLYYDGVSLAVHAVLRRGDDFRPRTEAPSGAGRCGARAGGLANAAFGFLGYYAMLSQNGSGRNTALAWCSVGFGAFYLGVRKSMERTPVAGRGGVVHSTSLADIQLSIAIVFLTLAVPLAVHGHWVTVGWMAEGAVLVWVATRIRTGLMRASLRGR